MTGLVARPNLSIEIWSEKKTEFLSENVKDISIRPSITTRISYDGHVVFHMILSHDRLPRSDDNKKV